MSIVVLGTGTSTVYIMETRWGRKEDEAVDYFRTLLDTIPIYVKSNIGELIIARSYQIHVIESKHL